MAFCMKCGTRLGDADRFCPACGAAAFAAPPADAAPTSAPAPTAPPPAPAEGFPDAAPLRADAAAIPRTGWSAGSETPAAKAFAARKECNAWIGFGVAVALILLVVVGLFAGAADLATRLGAAAVLAFVAVVVALRSSARRNARWDGVVADKRIRTKTKRSEHGPSRTHREYELVFQTSAGKRSVVRVTPSAYETFQVGETVRKLRGYGIPERWTKDPDRTVCCHCSNLWDVSKDACGRCGAPLFR